MSEAEPKAAETLALGAAPAGLRDRLRAPSQVSAEGIAVSLLLAYFALRMLCYAVWFHAHVPPDEPELFARTTFFQFGFGIPDDTYATSASGLIAHRPFLYFWVLGKTLWLNVFGIPDLLFARLMNVVLGVGTAGLVYRLAAQFTNSAPLRVLVLGAFTNTLQFSALSATVTYDNMANFLSVACACLLFALLRELTWTRLMLFLIAVLAGCQSKISFLPLAALFVFALIFGRRKTLRADFHTLRAELPRAATLQAALTAAVLVLLAINVEMYAGNVIRYGTIDAYPEKVIPLEQVLANRIARRDWAVEQYRTGKLDFEQAARALEPIQNAGNRARGMQLLKILRDRHQHPPVLVTPLRYAWIWTRIMIDRIVGFQGNGGYVILPHPLFRAAILAMMFYCLVAYALRSRADDAYGVPAYAFWLCFAYAMFLMWNVNYPLYRDLGAIDNAVNGRYLFPTLPLLYAIGARCSLNRRSHRAQLIAATLVVALFVLSDLPYLVANIGPCWFADAPLELGCAS